MFEYVKLKNFKSFENIEFNLVNKNGLPKHMALVYGRNAIGKSNLASAFFMLSETFHTMEVRDIMQSIISEGSDSVNNEKIQKLISKRYRDIKTLINEYKTVSSDRPLRIEFGFNNDGKKGVYVLETDNNQIIYERLEYTIVKNKGLFFEIKQVEKNPIIKINHRLFNDKKAFDTIFESCSQFWGKHSLVSILFHELNDKADQFIRQQLSHNFSSVLLYLFNVSCKVKFGSKQERGVIGLPKSMINSFEKGRIPVSEENRLERTEKMLNILFTSVYPDVKRVFFDKKYEKGYLHYQLFFSKKIAHKEREISFSLESTGTQALLDILPFLLVASNGSVAIIDEFDTGIHDVLIRDMISSLYKNLEGQLILTTNSTIALESEIPRENYYVITEENGDKNINPITSNNKIHKNANIRNQYIQNSYSGAPESSDINFNDLFSILDIKK